MLKSSMAKSGPVFPLFRSPLSLHPWIFFGIFLAALSLLSYFPLSFAPQLWISLFGLLLPLGGGLLIALRERKEKGIRNSPIQTSGAFPPWAWILLVLAFLLTRFYKLVSLPSWPLSDEGIFSFLAIGLMKKWHWALLWTEGQMEPLLLWTLSSFLGITGPSLLSLRLFTALLSAAGALAAFGAARSLLPPRLGFIFCWLFSLSFWEIALARQCTPNDFIPFFQLTAFLLAGIYWKSGDKSSSWFWVSVLGLWCGLGFYTYTNWAAIWAILGVLLLVFRFRKKTAQVVLFFTLSLSAAVPLALARMAPGATDHLQRNFHGFSPIHSTALYLRGLFWDGRDSFPLGPIWGGYFDVVTGALVLTGILYSIRYATRKNLAILGVGIFFSLLPGILTNTMELQRVTPSLIFFILLAALGARWLGAQTGAPFRAGSFLGLMAAPLLLNAYHFTARYCDLRYSPLPQQWRSVEYSDAYGILKNIARSEGPLYVFSEFNTDYDDKTLDIAAYPLNAVENPSLTDSRPRWTCVITNIQYAPYFIKTFRGLRFKVLKTDKTGPDDPKPFGIFLIPTDQIPVSTLEDWEKADGFYRQVDFQIKNKRHDERWAGFLEAASFPRDQLPKDPFLTSVYWEKLGFFEFLDGDFIQAAQAYRNAIRLGVPAAHLYYDLGVSLKLQNRGAESQECFKKAEALSKGSGE